MKIDLLKKIPQHMDTIILLLEEDYDLDSVEFLPPYVKELAEAWIGDSSFKAEFAALQSTSGVHKGQKYNLIICGAGEVKALTADKMRRLFASVVRAAIKLKAKTLYLYQSFPLTIGDVAYGHVLAEAALLTEYKFSKYFSNDDKHEIDALHLVKNIKSTRYFNCGVLEGRIFAESTNFARDLVNEPANVIFPESLAEITKKAALNMASISKSSMLTSCAASRWMPFWPWARAQNPSHASSSCATKAIRMQKTRPSASSVKA